MKQPKTKNERGIALLLAMITLLIVTSIALSMMFATDTETSINSNLRDEQTAFYAAKGGLEEMRDRMRTGATDTISASLPANILLPTAQPLPGAAKGVVYILNPLGSETVAPWNTANTYFDDEICKEVNCSGGQVPPTAGWYQTPALTASTTYQASPVLPYKWMRINLKAGNSASGWSGGTQNFMYVDGNSAHGSTYYACWNGTNEVVSSTFCPAPTHPVYEVTSMAVTPSGARRILQYEITQDSIPLNLPGALTLDGSNATLSAMSGASSNPYHMAGADNVGCGAAANGTNHPAIGVTNTPDIANVISGIPSNRQDHYTGGSAAPDVENISAGEDTSLSSVSGLNNLLAIIKTNVTQPVLDGTATPVTSLSNAYLGSSTNPQIIYVNGDLSLNGNSTGNGILVVTGTFTAGGNIGWNGLILVVGKGIFVGNGGGNNQYTGAVVVARTVDAMGNPLAALGSPTFNWSGGGGNGIYYSSGCIAQATALTDYRVLSSREMMY